jgi:hypothetical protein
MTGLPLPSFFVQCDLLCETLYVANEKVRKKGANHVLLQCNFLLTSMKTISLDVIPKRINLYLPKKLLEDKLGR